MTAAPAAAATQLLTIPQVQERLQLGRGTVYRLISAGDLPTVDLGNGRAKTRVREADLAAFIDGRRTTR